MPSVRRFVVYALTLAALAACPGPGPKTPPVLPEDSLGDTTVGIAYSHKISATGGTGALTYAATGLPAGLSMDSGGTLSGTATAGGDFNVAVAVTDSTAQTASKSYPLKVFAAPAFQTASLPDGEVGAAYSATVTVTGGKAPVAFTLTSGTLPAGVTLASTGALSGTPADQGSASVTVQARDANGAIASKAFSFAVFAPVVFQTTAQLPAGNVGTPYSTTLQATGGRQPISYNLTSGALPPGLTLASSGVLSGTPTAGGTFTFRVVAAGAGSGSAARDFSLRIAANAPPRITPSALPSGVVGNAYSATLTVGDGAPPFTWSLLGGTLPAGLTLAASGVISGVPTATGLSTVQVGVTDANGQSANVTLNLSVFTALRITTTALSDAYVGSGFTATLSATGGQAPFTWTFTGLPAGINAAASGLLSGTPTAAGSSGLIVTVADGSGQTVSQPLTLDVYDPPSLPAAALADGIVNGAYSQLLQATGGKLPYTFTLAAGALPAGISLATNGSLSGTPTASGSFPFTAQVADGNNRTAARTFTLNVFAGVAVTTATLPDGYSGTAYNQTLGAAGGRSPYTWAIASGSLPAGLTLSSGGVLSGTPSATGTFSFDVRVTDSATPAATSVRSLGLTVYAAPAIGTANLDDGYTGSAYSQTLSGTGGRSPYTFSVTTGALPAGLTLSSGGVLSGTPTATGTTNLTFTLSDANGVAASRSLTLAVFAPVAVSTSSLPTAYPAVAYSASLVASGGKAPITWTLTAGALAPGLSLSTAGAITGTPTTAGTYTFTVQAADANGRTGSRALTLSVDPSLTVTTANLADGYTGTAYSAALAATGGRAPYTFAVTGGALPNGLTLSTSGAVTGTPTTAGIASFTVQVTDANGSSATAALSLGVYAPPSVSTPALADGYVGSAYNASVSVSGGKAPFSWTHTSGLVPPGLAMDPSGNVTGTPTTPGAFPFTVRVSDANGVTANRQVSLEILAQLSVTTATLSDGYVGSAYSATLAATGGRGPYSWSVTAGALPAGLALSTTGALSGTPTATGNFSFTVRATDANGRTDSKALALAVVPALVVTTTSLADGYTGASYSGNVVASGGKAPYTFAVSAGALPAGISLSASGALSGTPTATGSANFTAQVTDANGVTVTHALTLSVYSAVVVTTSALADGYTGVAYSASLSATGGKAPLSWSVTGGALPAGVSLSAAGVLSGSPTATGAASFTVRATDANGVSASAPFTITVFTPPAITTSALPNGDVAVAYSAPALAATGGKSPLTWSISSGSLPTGLSLSASSGGITGTPSAGGIFTFTATVTDANGRSDNRALSISITGALAVATVSLPDGYTAAAYSAALSATGGRSPYSFSVPPGSLPSGLSLSAAGVFSGTPSATGTTTFTVTVTDANSTTATRNLAITVFTQPTVTTATLPDGYTNTAYSGMVAATGGKAPYTFALVGGSLPNGLGLSGSGALSGTPTAAGTSSFTVQVTDANGITGTRALSIAVLVPPSVSTTTLPDGYTGSAYSATLAATGGKAPYTWSVISGQLPTGLTLSSSGTISGTPTSPVAGGATVQVSDANGVSATQPISLIIYAAPAVTTASLTDGYVGVAYSATLAATGGKTPLTWSVSAGSLPAGLSLSSGGALSGTPTAAVNGSFSVTVSDANGMTSTRMLTLAVYAMPAISAATLPDGYPGTAYPSTTLTATGGKSPYTFSNASGGTMPAGLTLSSGGVIAGTPTTAGSSTFNVRVTDANGVSATRSFTVVVYAQPAITTASFADAYTGTAYSATAASTGGKAPISWSVSAGALPAGLSLSSAGFISGTPTAAGTASFTLRVTDANGVSATRALTLAVLTAVSVSTSSLADGYAGTAYSATLAATGGQTPYSWSITAGALPTGMTLSTSGVLGGTPTAAGSSSFTVQVSDANGASAARALTLNIFGALTITTASFADGYANASYSATAAATGGRTPYTWSVTSGSLPAGLTLTPATGAIQGSPSTAGTGAFSLTVVDANGASLSRSFSIVVYRLPVIVNSSLVSGVEGVTYRAGPGSPEQIVGQDGKAPLTYTAGNLPPGLVIGGTTGVISGIPAQGSAGVYSVNAVVTDANGRTVSKTLSLSVQAPQPIPFGGVAGVEPAGSPITDALTVFVVGSGNRGMPGIGVRVRRNGAEYSPVKQVLTDANGKAFFSGLGLNGTTDTVDITANGAGMANSTMAKVNGSVVTMVPYEYPTPLGRHQAAASYDPTVGRVFVTSGAADYNYAPYGCSNDVLRYQGSTNTWTEIIPPGLLSGPAARYATQMAHGGGLNVLFGGTDCFTGNPLGDTWELNGTTGSWTAGAQAGPRPTPRQFPVMTANATGDGVLLFGGYDIVFGWTNELWRYSASTHQWTQLSPLAPPAARQQAAGVYHAPTAEMWICGGSGNTGELSDCAAYTNANTWVTKASLPQPRSNHGMASMGSTLYVFGGSTNNVDRNDLLANSGAGWVTVSLPPGNVPPPARSNPTFVHDASTGRLLLFGGGQQNGAVLSDWWTYEPANGWVQRSPAAPVSNTLTVSGTLSGKNTTNSVVRVSAVTSSGTAPTMQVRLTPNANPALPATGTYSLSGIPAGDTFEIVAFLEDRTLAYPANPSRFWSSVTSGVLPAGTTAYNIALPLSSMPLTTTTGTYTLPGDWKSGSVTGRPRHQRPGYSVAINGGQFVDAAAKTFRFDYFAPSAPVVQNIYLSANNNDPGQCEFSVAYPSSPPPVGAMGNIAIQAGPRGVTPGQSICTPVGSGLNPHDYVSVDAGVVAVALGDVNGDGLLDLATANTSSNSVSVAFGTGGGSFGGSLGSNYAVLFSGVSTPTAVGFADLDSDGRVELLVANAPSGGGNLSVFRWTSGVTFTGPTFYALPVGPTALATRDINGDGRVDAVVTCNGPHVVAPLLNNGAGGFTGGPSTALPAGANPRAIALADVNADGRTDAVVANFGLNTVSVLTGNGSGGFTVSTSYGTNNGPRAVALGDVNGDTRLDLVVANETAGNLQLFHGSAGGLFTTPALFLASGATPSAVAIADFDGDTFQDVVATMAGSSSLVLYKSFGNAGIFSLADSEYVPAPQAVALGDVLMDGRVDVVVAAQGASQAYVLTQARPLPSASDANFSFNAPSGTRMFIAARSAYQMGTDWDYTSRGVAGANSFSFPLASTLAPSRPAPSNQAVSWSMGTYTFPAGAPFNYDNFRWPFIRSLGGADGFGQTQGHAYIRP